MHSLPHLFLAAAHRCAQDSWEMSRNTLTFVSAAFSLYICLVFRDIVTWVLQLITTVCHNYHLCRKGAHPAFPRPLTRTTRRRRQYLNTNPGLYSNSTDTAIIFIKLLPLVHYLSWIEERNLPERLVSHIHNIVRPSNKGSSSTSVRNMLTCGEPLELLSYF